MITEPSLIGNIEKQNDLPLLLHNDCVITGFAHIQNNNKTITNCMNNLAINLKKEIDFRKIRDRKSSFLSLLRFKTFLLFVFLFLLSSAVFSQGDYYDQFNIVSYGNNDGSLNFATNWVESGDDGSASGGRIRITGNRLRFDNIDSRTINRTLNLATATNVNLTFTYDANSRGNETLLVQLWNNGSSSWDTAATLNTTTTGSVSHTLTTNQISAAPEIRFISGSGGWGTRERIYRDDDKFVTSLPNTPPTLTATGIQDHCAGPGNSIYIATAVSITDPDDTSTSAIYVQISSGYVNGEDLLTLDNLGTHSANGITSSWDAVQGELTLTGPALYTDFEAAILDVLYSSSSSTANGSRQFSITVGEANFLPSTGHYYEFVANTGITWTAAKAAAAARTYFGLTGYLATLITQVEADFSGSQALGVGWMLDWSK